MARKPASSPAPLPRRKSARGDATVVPLSPLAVPVFERTPAAIPQSSQSTSKEQISEQIARLQQRQLEMVQQTSQELESLKVQLQESSQLEELSQQLATLEAENRQLKELLAHHNNQVHSQHGQAEAVLNSVKNLIASQAQNLDQQIKLFSLDSTRSIEGMLETLQTTRLAAPESIDFSTALTLPNPQPAQRAVPIHQSVAAPVHFATSPLPVTEQPKTLEKKKKSSLFKGTKPKAFALRVVTAALIGFIAFQGWTKLEPNGSAQETGSVAGVTTAAATPSFETYSESFADVSFENTEWANTQDFDFGLKLEYPKNATNRVRIPGGSSLTFLRKNGYLLKVSQIQTPLSLDEWWKANEKTYTEGMKVTTTTFKGLPAVYVESKQRTITSGSSYFIKRQDSIYQIWIKDEPASTDDGQRLTKMVETLTFTN